MRKHQRQTLEQIFQSQVDNLAVGIEMRRAYV